MDPASSLLSGESSSGYACRAVEWANAIGGRVVDDPEFGPLPTSVNTSVGAHPQTQAINEEFGWEHGDDVDDGSTPLIIDPCRRDDD